MNATKGITCAVITMPLVSKNLHVRRQKHTYWHSKASLLSSNSGEDDEKAMNR